jgi:hypothetical protein
VLAQQRRRRHRRRRGAVVAERAAGHGDVAERAVVEVVDESEVADLLPVVDLGHGADPAGGHACGDQVGEHVVGLALGEQAVDLGLQRVHDADPVAVGGDVGPVGVEPDDVGEATPQRLGPDGDDQGRVRAPEAAVGSDGRVAVAGAARLQARGEPPGAVEGVDRGDRGQQAGLDRPAAAGGLALAEGGHHAEGAEHACQQVGDRQPDAGRVAVGGAGQAHQPGLGLDDLVEAGSRPVGTAGAEAGDRERDQARVVLAQGGGVQAEPGEQAGPVVLDEHVGLGAQRAQPVGTRGVLEVQPHRPLAAVGGEEVRRLGGRPLRGAVGRLDERQPAAAVVAGGRLDLQHVGADVGEHHRGVGPGERAAQVDDPDACEGPVVTGGVHDFPPMSLSPTLISTMTDVMRRTWMDSTTGTLAFTSAEKAPIWAIPPGAVASKAV